MKNDWKLLNGKFPEDVKEKETVWLYNIDTNLVILGCFVCLDDGWFWVKSNGVVYAEEGKIITECELDEEYFFTHYCKLPELPIRK